MNRYLRSGAMAGIAGAVITIVAFLIGGSPPTSDDSVGKVREYLFDHRAAIRWQTLLFGLSAVFLVWFFASFGAALTRGNDLHPLHASLPLVGFVALAAIGMTCALPMTALVWRNDPSTSSDAIVRMAWDLNAIAAIGVAAAALVIFAGAATMIRSTGRFPAWLGWLATLGVILAVISLFTLLVDPDSPGLAPGGLVSAGLPLIVAMVFIIATSIVILREDAAP